MMRYVLFPLPFASLFLGKILTQNTVQFLGSIIHDQNDKTLLINFLSSIDPHTHRSKSKADGLIKDLERVVAYGSVRFARSLAKELHNATGESLLSLFVKQCIFDDEQRRRPVVCCLGNCTLEMEVACTQHVPFVIRVRLSSESTEDPSSGTIVAVFMYNGVELVPLDPEKLSDDTVVFVADAVSTRFGAGNGASPSKEDVQLYIETLNLMRLWLSGAAAHCQFAGENKNSELTVSPTTIPIIGSFQEMVDAANREGTSSANRSALFVDHSYVTTFGLARRYGGRHVSQDYEPEQLGDALYYPVPVEATTLDHSTIDDSEVISSATTMTSTRFASTTLSSTTRSDSGTVAGDEFEEVTVCDLTDWDGDESCHTAMDQGSGESNCDSVINYRETPPRTNTIPRSYSLQSTSTFTACRQLASHSELDETASASGNVGFSGTITTTVAAAITAPVSALLPGKGQLAAAGALHATHILRAVVSRLASRFAGRSRL